MAFTDSVAYNTLVTATHHTIALYALRAQLSYDALVELDNTQSTHRGSSHNFNFYGDMAVATTPLVETTDVTPVALADTQRIVTIQEYGAAVETTAFLRGTSYMEVNPIVDNIIGYNGGLSIDTVARNRLESAAGVTDGGVANVVYSDAGSPVTTGTEAARTRIAVTDLISAQIVQFPTAKLRGAEARPFGQSFKGIIHPDVSYDLRLAAPNNSWADPHIHVDPSGIYNGVVGVFGGTMWMESSRASKFADASNGAGAAGTIDVYGTYVFAHEAFGCMYSTGDAYGREPVFVYRPPTDYLERFRSAGWKHMAGYLVTREECVWRAETASSIGLN